MLEVSVSLEHAEWMVGWEVRGAAVEILPGPLLLTKLQRFLTHLELAAHTHLPNIDCNAATGARHPESWPWSPLAASSLPSPASSAGFPRLPRSTNSRREEAQGQGGSGAPCARAGCLSPGISASLGAPARRLGRGLGRRGAGRRFGCGQQS